MNNEPTEGTSYDVGDTQTVDAAVSTDPDTTDVHEIELVDPVGRIGFYWKCDRCGTFYQDPVFFEVTPCTPWGQSDE